MDVIICYFVVLTQTGVIESVLLSVQDLDLVDVEAMMKPLDSGSSQGEGYWGLIVLYMTYVHLIRCYDYGFYSDMIR